MKSRKGVTLIELMVVVLIVAVLAAVLVPLLTARLESARWSEGKAGVGTIATAVRAMYAEQGPSWIPTTAVADYVNAADMYGKYFQITDYSFQTGPTVVDIDPTENEYPVTFTIRVSAPGTSPDGEDYSWAVPYWEMTHTGTWIKGTAGP